MLDLGIAPAQDRASLSRAADGGASISCGEGRDGPLRGLVMPTLSTFYGILIQMFWEDHSPPHFHALYAEHEAVIELSTLAVMEGTLPRRALALVLEWAQEHRDELNEDWELCASRRSPKKIAPLR